MDPATHEITIDLTIPANAAAFADCKEGDTKILTVGPKEEGVSLVATVEKGEYVADDEADEGEGAVPAAPAMTGPPSKGAAYAVGTIK